MLPNSNSTLKLGTSFLIISCLLIISYGSLSLSLTCVVYAICNIGDINYEWTGFLWFCTPPLNVSRLKNHFFCCYSVVVVVVVVVVEVKFICYPTLILL